MKDYEGHRIVFLCLVSDDIKKKCHKAIILNFGQYSLENLL